MTTPPAHLLWDNHAYMAPVPGTASIEALERHRRAGFSAVFLNLGDADRSLEHIVRLAAFARRWLLEHPDRFVPLRGVADVDRAFAEGKLAVGFDIEGMHSLQGRTDAISLYHDLGVRWMALVYNRANECGSGVHDAVDGGLTAFGREVVREMDRVGMLKCLSHTGYRTAMDVLTGSDRPCVFSHSNALALKRHARNIPDELIQACAATGGVIGVNGIDIFLGHAGAEPQLMVEHIDHIVQQVGIDHVGIGLDAGYMTSEELASELANRDYWPPGNEYEQVIECVQPEAVATVIAGLQARGYARAELAQVMGLNMRRVAQAVWR